MSHFLALAWPPHSASSHCSLFHASVSILSLCATLPLLFAPGLSVRSPCWYDRPPSRLLILMQQTQSRLLAHPSDCAPMSRSFLSGPKSSKQYRFVLFESKLQLHLKRSAMSVCIMTADRKAGALEPKQRRAQRMAMSPAARSGESLLILTQGWLWVALDAELEAAINVRCQCGVRGKRVRIFEMPIGPRLAVKPIGHLAEIAVAGCCSRPPNRYQHSVGRRLSVRPLPVARQR